jgi:thiol:disulfide interchange protein
MKLKTSGVRWILLILVGLVLFQVVRAWMAPIPALTDWGHDWTAAKEEAGRMGRPMLVLFTADWCAPCTSLKRDVLTAPDVAPQLKRDFTLMKVDLTTSGTPYDDLARIYSVSAIPTLMVFSPKGETIGRLEGLGSKSELEQWFAEMARKGRESM